MSIGYFICLYILEKLIQYFLSLYCIVTMGLVPEIKYLVSCILYLVSCILYLVSCISGVGHVNYENVSQASSACTLRYDWFSFWLIKIQITIFESLNMVIR